MNCRALKNAGSALILLLVGGSAAAQMPPKHTLLENLAFCNGSQRASPETQINGCTAVIAPVGPHAPAAAMAYNNRGDAYIAKGDYDLAISDFDQSIKLTPTNPKPFNNRALAYLKKGEYGLS